MLGLSAEKTKKGYAEAAGAKSNGAAKPAAKASGVKPSELVVKAVKIKASTIHRIVLADHKLVATGQACTASSDGKTFRRRDNPGTSYMLAAIDGAIYSGGGPV